MELDESIVLYSLRHTFATELLLTGTPIAIVAKLMGHKDTRMVSKVYGHLEKHPEELRESLRKRDTK
jgi:integrase